MKLSLLFASLASLLIVLIAWPIGGNYPHVSTATIAIGLLMVILALIGQSFPVQNSSRPPKLTSDGHSATESGRRQRFNWIWIMVVLGTAYAAIQVVPGIGDTVAGMIRTTDADLTNPQLASFGVVASDNGGTISAYPAASRLRLTELLGAVAIFFASFSMLTTKRAIKIVFIASVITGVAIGFVGVIQKLAGNGKVLWVYEMLHDGGFPFGPFVNKNSAGGFLLACLSGAVFVLALQLFSWRPFNPAVDSERSLRWPDGDSNGKIGPIKRILGFIAGLKTQHLYMFAAFAFIGFSIVATLSRGATFALATAAAISIIFLSTVNRWVLVFALMIACAGVGLAFYAEQSDVVTRRLETITDISNATAPRMLHWEESWPYIKSNLVTGAGIGTHAYMYLPDQERHFNKWFIHAENVYLETLGELGVAGLVILLTVILLCIGASWRLFRSVDPLDRATGVAGMCLIWGQAISAFADFGIYSPANFAIVGVLLGAVTGRAAVLPAKTAASSAETQGKMPAIRTRQFRIAVLTLVAVGCVWAIRESHGAECTHHAARIIKQYKRSSGTKDEQLDLAGWLLARAAAIRPDDSETHYQTGEYHVARYRQAVLGLIVHEESNDSTDVQDSGNELNSGDATESPAVTQSTEPTPSSSFVDRAPQITSTEQGWPVTSLATLHRFAHTARRLDSVAYQELTSAPEVRDHLQNAWQSFLEAEKNCHVLAKTQFRLAELSIVMEMGLTEQARIAETINRTPKNSKVLYDCGVLAINAGDVNETTRLWKECLSYSRVFEEEIVQFGRAELPMKMFFEEVLRQDPEELLRISRKYFSLPEQTLSQRLLLVHTKRLIDISDLPSPEKFFLTAEAQRMSGVPASAAKSYALALEGEEIRVEWRFKYARTLHQLKQYDEAVKQLNICGRRPSRLQARIARLLTQIKRERKRESPVTTPDNDIPAGEITIDES